MLFNSLAVLAIAPFLALAAPLAARQNTAATLSGSLTAPADGASVVRGPTGLLTLTYTPGPETAWIDVEVLTEENDDDDDDEDQDTDLDSDTLVEGWAPTNGTEAMTASFRLVDDDKYDTPSQGDDDAIPCDGTFYLRVVEHQITTGTRTTSVRGPRTTHTLSCASA